MKKLTIGELPAFPISEEETDRIEEGVNIYYGLTKREYFAAKAMQGILSGRTNDEDPGITRYLIKYSIQLADELIKSLNN